MVIAFYFISFFSIMLVGWLVVLGLTALWDSISIYIGRSGRVVRRCWVNFQCWGVLPIWIIVGQGPIVLAVGAGGGCLDIFSLIYHFFFLSPSLWETAQYRLKYCLKGPLSPKQPTNQLYRSVSHREGEWEARKDREKQICPNNAHPHLLQAQ